MTNLSAPEDRTSLAATKAPTPLPAEFTTHPLPLIKTEEVAHCPVCGGREQTSFADGYDYELQTCANLWHFVQCSHCEHVWLNPRPAVDELSVIYPPTYYAYNYNQQINAIARRGKELLDSLKLKSILKHLSKSPQSFLDVGCGDGRWLKAMQRRGLSQNKLYGLELDAPVVEKLVQEGFQAYCERVETCDKIPPGQIDLATMFHVIEHVDDPQAVVRKIAESLSPGGIFAIETPNIDSWDRRLFHDTYWGGYHIPRHWNLFRATSLQRLLQDAGLKVVDTKYQTGHSFWMYSFHHRLRYGTPPRPRLARWFDPFRSLLPLVGFTGLDRVRAMLGYQTSAMMMLARKPG